ncbi:hypothetical protein FS749_007234 [Ceratobasidium sp. UAMH 11750]|nr:hypothetical protein FS749_007234 [Ceratobasidium sp. UAMH 11750]
MHPGNPALDALVFGQCLNKLEDIDQPPPFRLHGGHDTDKGDGSNNGDDAGPEEPDNLHEPDELDEPDKLDEDGNGPPKGPPIQVEAGGDPPGPEDVDNGIAALNEHPVLRNIYLRTWGQYAFAGATQNAIQSILESHKLVLCASVELGVFPPEFMAEIEKMPTTLRALESRIGMDFSDVLTIYPVCPECGKCYTMDELFRLRDPQCIQHMADPQCSGILYTEATLADGTQKRTPTKSFPYNSLLAMVRQLLSHIGITDFMQHWRCDRDEPVNNAPPPVQPQEWFNRMEQDNLFGQMDEAWGWRSQATGLEQHFVNGEYVDEARGVKPLSLSHLPLGLNLGMNMDGFRASLGKFVAAGHYSVNGVYIVVNNLPPHLCMLIENMILVIAVPGPKEQKG